MSEGKLVSEVEHLIDILGYLLATFGKTKQAATIIGDTTLVVACNQPIYSMVDFIIKVTERAEENGWKNPDVQ